MVSVYLVTVIGIPVYFHYCGGELEEISYVVKSNGCCGEEEEDESESDGCCQNENTFVRLATDFTLKKAEFDNLKLLNVYAFIETPYLLKIADPVSFSSEHYFPPPLCSGRSALIKTTFLRI